MNLYDYPTHIQIPSCPPEFAIKLRFPFEGESIRMVILNTKVSPKPLSRNTVRIAEHFVGLVNQLNFNFWLAILPSRS